MSTATGVQAVDTGWDKPTQPNPSKPPRSLGSPDLPTVNSTPDPNRIPHPIFLPKEIYSSVSLDTLLEDRSRRLSPRLSPDRNRRRALSDPLSPTDTDSSIDSCPSPASPCVTPDSRSIPPLTASDIQRLYELVAKLYIDKNTLAFDMQEKLNASELRRTEAESSAASFKMDALLWKQRSSTLEQSLIQTNSRLQEIEKLLMVHDQVVSGHQRWIQKKQTIESEPKWSTYLYAYGFVKLILILLGIMAVLGVDPRRLFSLDYFREEYFGM